MTENMPHALASAVSTVSATRLALDAAQTRHGDALGKLQMALALHGRSLALTDQRDDSDVINELYWAVPDLAVADIAAAYRIKGGAGAVHQLVRPHAMRHPCLGCDEILTTEVQSRSEALSLRGMPRGAGQQDLQMRFCADCLPIEQRRRERLAHERNTESATRHAQETADIERSIIDQFHAGRGFPEPDPDVYINVSSQSGYTTINSEWPAALIAEHRAGNCPHAACASRLS